MANNWKLLNKQFLKENSLTDITVKEWCGKNNLIYNTARRYIRNGTKHAQLRGNTLSNKNVKDAQKTLISKSNKDQIQLLRESEEDEVIHDNSTKIPGSKKRVKSLGNQNARTHGHYSEFITTDEDALRHDSALNASLFEELALIRMQLANLMVGIKKVEAKLNGDLTIDQTLAMYEKYAKLQTNFDVKIGRIESLENSIINHKKITADIEKTIVLTQKTQLEADKLRSESSDGNATLTEIYNEILAMGGDGMMNTI
jgi:hypothetical protein